MLVVYAFYPSTQEAEPILYFHLLLSIFHKQVSKPDKHCNNPLNETVTCCKLRWFVLVFAWLITALVYHEEEAEAGSCESETSLFYRVSSRLFRAT